MVKLRQLSGKEPGNPTVTVPVPMHKELKAGTLLSIIRQSGIPKTNFESQ